MDTRTEESLRKEIKILRQDLSRMAEEKASLKKTILWQVRQRCEPSLSDTRDIDASAQKEIAERILIRHLQQIDHVLSTAYEKED